MFITKPELQKPHCEPLYWASVVEMGLNWPAEGLCCDQYCRHIPPRAILGQRLNGGHRRAVDAAQRAQALPQSAARRAWAAQQTELTLKVAFFCCTGLNCVSDTTHAPQPPSWHDFLVPCAA